MPHKDPEQRQRYARESAKARRSRDRVIKHSARSAEIARLPSPPSHDCAWAAGHFEGEGTVTLSNGGRHANCRPLISLTSTDADVIDFFQVRWPGQVRTFQPRSPNARIAHCWRLQANGSVEVFLRDISPHLRTKRVKDKVAIVLEDVHDRRLHERDPGVRGRSRLRKEAVQRMNQRGNIVLPNGRTVGEEARPAIAAAYATNAMQPLLPPPTT